MPRTARADYPGSIHHIVNYAINQQSLFCDELDYKTFLSYFADLMAQSSYQCHAWVLLPGQFHFLIQTSSEPIAHLMRRLQTRYAVYFNAKYKRKGYVFQGRYQSVICNQDDSFKERLAYIHLSPLRLQVVKNVTDLERFRWSSYRALMGQENWPWPTAQTTLSYFANTQTQARLCYQDYLKSMVLNGQVLVPQRPKTVQIRQKSYSNGPQVKIALNLLAQKVSVLFNVDPEQICQRGKSCASAAQARALLVYFARRWCAKSLTDLANFLNISQAAVSKLYYQGAKSYSADAASLLKQVQKD